MSQPETRRRAGFASLHAGLLARKGEAAPAPATPPAHLNVVTGTERDSRMAARSLDGVETVEAKPTAPEDGAAPVRKRPEASATEAREKVEKPEKARVSLRLNDRQRRLLRLVAAATDRSHQEILSAGLDMYLQKVVGDELGHCRCLRRFLLHEGQDEEAADCAASGGCAS